MNKSCGTCTKCCEGWLEGEAFGHKFYPGKPCGFVTIGKGCNSYALRPKEPCVNYKCAWLSNNEIPDWLKPNLSNVIINYNTIDGIAYIKLVEAGQTLPSKVLSWMLKYAIAQRLNIAWTIDEELYWIGSPEFNLLMQDLNLPKHKSVHSKPKNLLPVVVVE